MSNLALRTITGFIGAAILLTGIVYSEPTFLLLLVFISSMALLEFYNLCEKENIKPQKTLGIVINIIFENTCEAVAQFTLEVNLH